MQTLAKQVLEHAAGLPEGTPLVAKELLHLGSRAAVDQVLSRLVQRGTLIRAGRGIYVRPVENRFGTRAPSTVKMVEGLANQRGEIIVSHGAAAANALGLTTQVPMRAVYLTSGRSRRLKLGAQTVEFRHAPIWQLIFPGRAAGDVVRALAWLGPEKASEAIRMLRSKLPPSELEEVASARARLPTWMAQEVSSLVTRGTNRNRTCQPQTGRRRTGRGAGAGCEASKLALEEAAGRAQTFSGEDLARARADMESLETIFLETLRSSVSGAKDVAGEILYDLAAHARIYGSVVGAQLKETLAVMTYQLDAAARAQVGTGLHLAQATSDALRQIAAGVLTGLADHVNPGQSSPMRGRLTPRQALTAVRDLSRLRDIASILIRYGIGDMVRRMRLAASLALVAPPGAAAPTWLIATADETAQAGAPIVLDVVKPAAQAEWPDIVRLRVVRDGGTLEVELAAVGPMTAAATRRTYRGVLPADLSGLVRVELAGAESSRLVLVVSTQDAIERMQFPVDAAVTPAAQPGAAGTLLFPANEPALSANEPMYFVVGGNGGLTARFQLSFKYRLFDPAGPPVQWFPLLSRLHFGYTQNSIWDLGANSAPFRDTSYRPSLFWQGAPPGKGRLMPHPLRAGFEHESNGKDGVNSRSINTLFAQPVWRTGFSDGRTLIFAPKVYGYLEKEGNPDIQRYRGYADWNLRYGREDGWLLATQLRRSTAGRGSAQFDLSYPLRQPIFARTGGFLHLQLFKGYGESLLGYNLDRGTQVRVGFSIVR